MGVKRGSAYSRTSRLFFYDRPDCGRFWGADRPDPDHRSYFSFVTLHDPDGNTWLFQEVTSRLPGRGVGTFDVASLTEVLREAEEHHGEYESTAPRHHWSRWYAAYVVARQQGKTPQEAAAAGKSQIEGSR